MTAHELARKLLEGPDLRVVIFAQNDTFYDSALTVDTGTAWIDADDDSVLLTSERCDGVPVTVVRII